MRIVLADNHTMFREGLAAILASRAGVEVVGHAPTGEGAFALVEQKKPDVVITQIEADLKTAKEILSGIRSASPGSRIVVLTVLDNLHYVQALSRLGIGAYVHKSSSGEELLATIDVISCDPGADNMVVSIPRGSLERMGEGPVGVLSERETEVLVLVARGLSNRLIAALLSVSEATVKRRLANVYQKIGVRSRSEAVRTAPMEQWIGLRDNTAADRGSSSGGRSL